MTFIQFVKSFRKPQKDLTADEVVAQDRYAAGLFLVAIPIAMSAIGAISILAK